MLLEDRVLVVHLAAPGFDLQFRVEDPDLEFGVEDSELGVEDFEGWAKGLGLSGQSLGSRV